MRLRFFCALFLTSRKEPYSFFLVTFSLSQKKKLHKAANEKQQRKHTKVEGRENQEILLGLAGIVFGKLTERDQARKRRDQRTRTADIDTEKQFPVIFRKLRKQNGRRNVADDLAGKSTDNTHYHDEKQNNEYDCTHGC